MRIRAVPRNSQTNDWTSRTARLLRMAAEPIRIMEYRCFSRRIRHHVTFRPMRGTRTEADWNVLFCNNRSCAAKTIRRQKAGPVRTSLDHQTFRFLIAFWEAVSRPRGARTFGNARVVSDAGRPSSVLGASDPSGIRRRPSRQCHTADIPRYHSSHVIALLGQHDPRVHVTERLRVEPSQTGQSRRLEQGGP
ncbi:UNVERIFIED_CONTAM: hypothetical protein PYX00_004806 [Menopon gallinae]|uniref:Uncharacterized protein n=1 Tax=Menopon gallinae TaxID=328185 RepID=A0AAW2I712_9NEOP